MKTTAKLATIIAIAAMMVAGVVFLSACGSERDLVGTVWHFDSIEPESGALSEVNEEEAADIKANSEMLAIFLQDAEMSIEDGGKFVFTFLSDDYEGTWEKVDNGIHVTMPQNDYTSAGGTYVLKDGKLVFTADENAGRLVGYTVVYAEGAYEKPAAPESDASPQQDSKSDTAENAKSDEQPEASADAQDKDSGQSEAAGEPADEGEKAQPEEPQQDGGEAPAEGEPQADAEPQADQEPGDQEPGEQGEE